MLICKHAPRVRLQEIGEARKYGSDGAVRGVGEGSLVAVVAEEPSDPEFEVIIQRHLGDHRFEEHLIRNRVDLLQHPVQAVVFGIGRDDEEGIVGIIGAVSLAREARKKKPTAS